MSDVSGTVNSVPPRQFDEKIYRRHALIDWESKWNRLSTEARYYVLHHVLVHGSPSAFRSAAPTVSLKFFPRAITEELSAGGFISVRAATGNGNRGDEVACEGLADFAQRATALRRYQPLAQHGPVRLAEYVNHVYFTDQLTEVLSGVLSAARMTGSRRLDELLKRYVVDHRWPFWVAKSLNDPLADQILGVVRDAKWPVPLSDLPARIAGSDPIKVRAVVDKLVARLALVEDLRPATWELIIGFLPVVRENMIIASMPQERPPLRECTSPRELGPDGSPIVNDLRAVLLEVASQPPQLRQNLSLFQKETARFQAVLDPLAGWLTNAMQWSAETRPNRAIAWARILKLARVDPEGKHIRLQLSPDGQAWLSAGASEEHLEIFPLFRTAGENYELYWPQLELSPRDKDPWETSGPADEPFLGTRVVAVKAGPGNRLPRYNLANHNDHLALRRRLDLALAELKPGVFYQLESVESHLVFAEHNPLNLGLPAADVAVFLASRPVPPPRLQREEVGREVIRSLVLQRLVPFGCFQAAIDDEGRICVARGPRFDGYFGREIPRAELPPSSDVAARVVVQPDFSVVIIGPNPAPAAALAPFCERTTRGGGQGAVVLKLTRESVVKAVKNGLKSDEITARLKRHASNDLPANVLRQVEDWSNWVRRVTTLSLIALRCPDSETADRVMAVMKRQAERVNSTVVAIDRKKLTTTERNKLEDHGILVEDEPTDLNRGPGS
jgi:hypothetical protein